VNGYKVITDAPDEQKKSQHSTWSKLQAIADMKFTYVAACQNYGEQKRQSHHNAAEILNLMLKYALDLLFRN
jgi:callose synthase